MIVDGLPEKPSLNRAIALNDRGELFVAVVGQTNNCTAPDAPKVGLMPCPELVGPRRRLALQRGAPGPALRHRW